MNQTFQQVGAVFAAIANAEPGDVPPARPARTTGHTVLLIDGADLTLYLDGRSYELRWPRRVVNALATASSTDGEPTGVADGGVLLPVIGPGMPVDRVDLAPGRVAIRHTGYHRGRLIAPMPCCGRGVPVDGGGDEALAVCCRCRIGYRARLLDRGHDVALTVIACDILVASHGGRRRPSASRTAP